MTRKVCVIGAGIIGLSTAVCIIEQIPDVQVTIIADKFTPETTGDGANGVWSPVLSGQTCIDVMTRWGSVTWDHLTDLLHSEDAAPAGVKLVLGYHLYTSQKEEPYWKDIVLGFRRISTKEIQTVFPVDCGFTHGFSFNTIVTECSTYLPWLTKRFQQKGGKIQCRRICSIGEVDKIFDVVVNCSGVHAYHLVNDKEVTVIKGQMVKVRASWQKWYVSAKSKNGVVTNLTPKSDHVVLGSTRDFGNWDTDVCLDVSIDIYNRCCKLVPSLKNAEIIGGWSGLRPGRTSVRLARENMMFGLHILPVVHNYGHGGSGVTLHWGCAQDATELVRQCLQDLSNFPSKL
ncbi:D-aspartate oxidase-like [Amphiura filiformis]|uniref:D-aspartate oxidase-like n=1 Tax=Amphiura filiformis TaxID=82378 RepID=UPI003B224AA1